MRPRSRDLLGEESTRSASASHGQRCYPGQRRLGFREPEGHLHGTIEVDGRSEGSAGLLPLAGLTAYSVPRPRWQCAWSGRMPGASARARACW